MNIKESELKQEIYYVWKCPTCKTKAKEFEELENIEFLICQKCGEVHKIVE